MNDVNNLKSGKRKMVLNNINQLIRKKSNIALIPNCKTVLCCIINYKHIELQRRFENIMNLSNLKLET